MDKSSEPPPNEVSIFICREHHCLSCRCLASRWRQVPVLRTQRVFVCACVRDGCHAAAPCDAGSLLFQPGGESCWSGALSGECPEKHGNHSPRSPVRRLSSPLLLGFLVGVKGLGEAPRLVPRRAAGFFTVRKRTLGASRCWENRGRTNTRLQLHPPASTGRLVRTVRGSVKAAAAFRPAVVLE